MRGRGFRREGTFQVLDLHTDRQTDIQQLCPNVLGYIEEGFSKWGTGPRDCAEGSSEDQKLFTPSHASLNIQP